MRIEIKIGRCKQDSEVLIDGCRVVRGVLDFGVDLSGPFPVVMLKVRPERLTVSGELGAVIQRDLLSSSWRRGMRQWCHYAVYSLFRNVRMAREEMREIWREAHPSNEERRWLWRTVRTAINTRSGLRR